MPTQSLHVFLIITVLSVVLPAQKQSTRNTPFTPNQFPLPVKPPADAVVLSDGDTTSLFLSMAGTAPDWPGENGCLISSRGTGRTNHLALQLHFHDAEIHVEFMVDPQGRGNSGLYIHGLYALQIFDSFGTENPVQEDQGALYGFARPPFNAPRKSGEWQVYDIRYLAPRRDRDENIIRQGSITAWLNGQLIHKQTRFGEPRSKYHPFRYGTTPYLQDHHSPTKFRNIWIRPLDQHGYLYAPKQCERENSVDSQTGRP
ncbi:MAG: DUF1080 domain-containing protein [Planctomycetaceae bacterium]